MNEHIQANTITVSIFTKCLIYCTCTLAKLSLVGLEATKPVFGDSDKTRLKPISSATKTSYKIDNSLVASLDRILSNERITTALIRLRGCAGWCATLLFAKPEDRFSWSRPILI